MSLRNSIAELDGAVAAAEQLPPVAPDTVRLAREATVCDRARVAVKTFAELVIFRGAVDEDEQAALTAALARAKSAIRLGERYRQSVASKLADVRDGVALGAGAGR